MKTQSNTHNPFLKLERKLSNYLGTNLAFGKSKWWRQSFAMIETLSPLPLQGLENFDILDAFTVQRRWYTNYNVTPEHPWKAECRRSCSIRD